MLTQSQIGGGEWLDRIKNFVPGFAPDDSDNKVAFFDGGVYSLEVFMNIACAFPLYTRSNNVLSNHLSSILRYLALTIKNMNKPGALLNEVGFKIFFYLEGEPTVTNFVKFKNTSKTILGGTLPKQSSEYARVLAFDQSSQLIFPECRVDYSATSFSGGVFGFRPLPPPEVKRCAVCALESDQRICGNCSLKSAAPFSFHTPAANSSPAGGSPFSFHPPAANSSPAGGSPFSFHPPAANSSPATPFSLQTPFPFLQDRNKPVFDFGTNGSSSIFRPAGEFFQNSPARSKNLFSSNPSPFGFGFK